MKLVVDSSSFAKRYVQEVGSDKLTCLDRRDTARDRDTIPGVHRGGTHDHEYTLEGTRIRVTYDDALLPQYGRTIGYLEQHPKAPEGASSYFALLASVIPEKTAKPAELDITWGHNWVDAHGTMRAFIGKLRAEDGVQYEQSIRKVTVPIYPIEGDRKDPYNLPERIRLSRLRNLQMPDLGSAAPKPPVSTLA